MYLITKYEKIMIQRVSLIECVCPPTVFPIIIFLDGDIHCLHALNQALTINA
jgi:hypothetical protein